MMTALVRFSIRFSGVIIGLASLMIIYGIYSLTRSNLDVFPEFSPTQLIIQTESPGLSSDLVEKLVTQPIEHSISGTVGIAMMRSQSIPGLSVVTVIFKEGSDVYRNRQVVAERLATLSGRLPPRVIPNITPLTSAASTVMGIGLTSDKVDLKELRSVVDWELRPHLMAVEGVADVNVFGGQVRQLQIQVKPQQLVLHKLSLKDVTDAARLATGVRGAGFIESNNQRIILNTVGQTLTPQQLGQTTVAYRNGQSIKFADIADINEGAQPSISSASINGKTGIYLSIQGQLGANTYGVTQSLEQAIKQIKPALQNRHIQLHEGLFRPANFIDTAIRGVRTDILIGSVLVIIVLFLFLFNARTAFISATAIPLSLLTAIVVLSGFNIGINIMVLGGLAIALGEVVDDAIIDTENIFRRLRENKLLSTPLPIARVVFDASMEVRSSVVYATIIVALVFMPLLTLSGVAGKLFAPLGYAYISAILASLVVALTLTPALCYLLLGKAKLEVEDPPIIHWIKQRYVKLLYRIEQSYKSVILISVAIIGIGLATLPLFKSQFIPSLHEGHFIMHMTLVPGTSEQESLRIGNRASEAIRSIKGVKSVVQWVGRAQNGADTFGTHYSEFEIEIGTLSGSEQNRILSEIRERMSGMKMAEKDQDGNTEPGFVGTNFAINTFLTERIEETISGYAASHVINIFGNDLDALDRDAQAVAGVVAGIKGARDVLVQSPPGSPQLSIRLRHEKLALWGLHPTEVLDSISAAYESMPITPIYQGNRLVWLSVVLAPEMRQDLSELRKIPLFTREGKLVLLGDVADINLENGRSKILHAGAKRIQTVTANVSGRDVSSFSEEMKSQLKSLKLSAGNYLTFSGEAEAQSQSREDLIVHSLIATVGIFLMLYIAFGNFRNLLLTFINLPFALIGGVLAVMFTGGWISLGSMVGFVTLFGITLRNSIMLVSHYQHLINYEGRVWGVQTAIQGASERLPSILMTALVTALGLLPLAAGSGQPGREIEGPMAIIIVGGLITSTILNLLVLPTIMLHFGRFEKQQDLPTHPT